MAGEADMQPSTSKISNNDDSESDCLPDDFEDDDPKRELTLKKIDILKRKLKKLQDRSVDFENDEHEDKMCAQEESIQKQLKALLKKIDVTNSIVTLAGAKDLSHILVVEGTGSTLLDTKITGIMQKNLKLLNGGLKGFIGLDRKELVKLCKICRQEETGSTIPNDPQTFDDFISKTAGLINASSLRYRTQFYEGVWDDYLEDDEKETLKKELVAPTIQKERNIEEIMEELAKQVEINEDDDLDSGDDCSKDVTDESDGEDVIEDDRSVKTAVDETDGEKITTVDVPQQEINESSREDENADVNMFDPKDNDSFCEILDNGVNQDDGPEVLSISSREAINSTDDDYIEVVYEKELIYVEPVNSQKNPYVWNWLVNKCSESPDPLPEDEPDLKRARMADNELDDDQEVLLPPSVQAASSAVIVLD